MLMSRARLVHPGVRLGVGRFAAEHAMLIASGVVLQGVCRGLAIDGWQEHPIRPPLKHGLAEVVVRPAPRVQAREE